MKSQKRVNLQAMIVHKVFSCIYKDLNGCTLLFFLCSEHHPVTQGKLLTLQTASYGWTSLKSGTSETNVSENSSSLSY